MGEFPALLPELSNSGCRPGKAGGSPPLTLDEFKADFETILKAREPHK